MQIMESSMARKPKPTIGRMKEFIRQTEKKSQTGGTGFTILKMQAKPIRRLLDDRSIGPEEFQAVQDIEHAFFSMTGALQIKPLAMERIDPSAGGLERAVSIDAQARYKRWANHWTIEAKRGDKTLQIVIAAVIDERPFYLIEDDIGLRHGIARKATIAGLRDYAVRAGWVRGRQAMAWLEQARDVFRGRVLSLELARRGGLR